ncbi:hypothetical protein [Piscinibacter sp. HJYY11]|uniref:hypothetical protein n=1 Tax=Piscinibacter sp. HJYY11 TaxID=2801333 RepID=UPI00191FB8DF|nr:hypothetical protein [Piscinibacter sp. HJYY11]MBL0729588.1 hypothetical protein [Piscinibacter sp. HJYY11]
MTGLEGQESFQEDMRTTALAHEKVRQHFAAALEYFDEEFGPAWVVGKPQLLAAFVNAAAVEALATAMAGNPFGRLAEQITQKRDA